MLIKSTGRIVHIPNGFIFVQSQINYNQGFSHIWNEIGVLVTLESDWKKAKSLLQEILKHHGSDLTNTAQAKLIEASKKFMIFLQDP
ncbi:MAG: mechanosensitive ion channel [Bacteroidetes bacterium]|nr:mechanosensitive ion channel [Bacteroidota bacterium]MDA1121254.1 mechanosensitive ion channel [Bacteroidota bacterium]